MILLKKLPDLSIKIGRRIYVFQFAEISVNRIYLLLSIFIIDRAGFVMGEGCGVIILETEEHAIARGAEIYCELAGYGSSCDAYHITAPAPGGNGLKRCMEMALKDGDVALEDVGYINAHGTSTQLNDKTETEAIKSVFGDHAYKLKTSSIKSMIGHSLGATGGIELRPSKMASSHPQSILITQISKLAATWTMCPMWPMYTALERFLRRL